MNNSKYNCELIQDLLPLYQDNACSNTSRSIVDEHIADCDKCKAMLTQLQNTSVDDYLISEKNNVLEQHSKKEMKRTATIGIFTASILMIPVIICLICNLAIGHGLDWFFIVLTSLLVFASITVIPMVVRRNTILWTMAAFTVSLLLLLMTCCIYTGGDWFFIVSIPTIFGLSVIFMPYIICQIPLPTFLRNKKALLTMLWDTVWLYILILECGIYTSYAAYWDIALPITTFSLIVPWLMFLCIRYLKVHPVTKAGICTLITGIFSTFVNDFIYYVLYGSQHIKISDANLLKWGVSQEVTDANIGLLIFIVSLVIGTILIAAGTMLNRSKKEH
ncbi:MAG: zf-HC2 domain-containing protein [Lachnospiraceae bacterium]|nr:zf-HC2 domain-containing protein [Lachnospiraceae bacterium]